MTLEIPFTVSSSYDEMTKKVEELLAANKLKKSHISFSIFESVEEEGEVWCPDNWKVKHPDFSAVVEGLFEFVHYGKVFNPPFSMFILDAAKEVLCNQPCDHIYLESIEVEDGEVSYFFGS